MSSYSELMIDLSVAEAEAGRFASAASLLRSVLGASGRDAFVLYGLGHMAYRRGNYTEAAELLRQSVAMDATNAKAHNDLGLALFALGHDQAAFASLMNSWMRDEELALAVMTEGMEMLRRDACVAGWLKYEARLIARPGIRPRRDIPGPRWLGREDIAGQTILLHSEQGYGDAIQFVRYVPWVVERGARVLVEGHSGLMPLFRDLAGVAGVFALNEALPPFDVQCPLMSLPLAFRTDLAGIPAQIPYLHAKQELIATWRQRLGPPTGLRVAIVWSGNPANEADQERSIPLATLLPLLDVPGCEFHVIQTDVRPADRAVLDRLPAVRDHSAVSRDFAETAALISLMELVISVDTSLAHLGGALGLPVWLLLPGNPDWRWMAGRDDTPWYPTMRLFRQDVAGDWASVAATVAAELAAGQLSSSRRIGSR